MKAKEIMTKSVATCTPHASVQEAARLMQQHDTGVIPVVEDDQGRRLVGLVTDRDLAIRVLAQGRGGDAKVGEAMSEDVAGVGPDDRLEDVRRLMAERQVRRIPVVDEQGRCLGIISQADLALDDSISDKKVGKMVEDVSRPNQRH